MIERFVALCLRRRFIVWAVFFLVAVYGVVLLHQPARGGLPRHF